MKNKFLFSVLIGVAIVAGTLSFKNISPQTPFGDNAGLALPAGFSASIVANNLGEVRHISVTKEGDIYAKLGSAKKGKGILFLKSNNGKFQEQNGFGDYGGTGMRIHGGYLYASSNTDVYLSLIHISEPTRQAE